MKLTRTHLKQLILEELKEIDLITVSEDNAGLRREGRYASWTLGDETPAEVQARGERERGEGQQGEKAKATLRDLQNDLKILAKDMAGVDANEIKIYQLLIALLKKVKSEQTGSATKLRRSLGLAADAADEI